MTEDLFTLSDKRHFDQTTVVVCVADIRGFTTFVRKNDGEWQHDVPRLLRQFYEGLNEAFFDTAKNLTQSGNFGERILQHATPKLKKSLGDGVMLVWESPHPNEEELYLGFNIFVLDFIQAWQTSFYSKKTKFLDTFPHRKHLILPLEIGFGLACGNACRLDGLIKGQIDYAGTPLNLAARLQNEARPCGVVAMFDLMPNLFLERISMTKEGTIDYVIPKGIESGVPVWKALRADISRRSARDVRTFQTTRTSMLNHSNHFDKNVCPITVDDTKDIFSLREKFETEFVGDLVTRLQEQKISKKQLSSLNPSRRSAFHEGIAKLSAANKIEAAQRCAFVEWAYDMTREVHQYAPSDQTSEVKVDHQEIYEAIVQSKSEQAMALMRRHLGDNCTEGKTELLKEAEQKSQELLEAIKRATKSRKK
jgi:class 3 adenylate cyclase/DNA-binding FadR family transcriptional regulator